MSGSRANTAVSQPLEVQLEAIECGCAILADDRRAVIEVRGRDRGRFLNGLCTVDVKELLPGGGAYGFVTSAKGHILSDLVILALEDSLWLDLPAREAEEIKAHLTRYIVVDDVSFEDQPSGSCLTLAGPESASVLQSLAGSIDLSSPPWSHREVILGGFACRVVAEPRLGVPAWALRAPSGDLDALASAVLAASAPAGIVAAGREAREIVRIRHAIPNFQTDFGPDNLPQEVSIAGAVDFDKGCYLGQEVIARLHYRGQAARWLCRIRIEGEAAIGPGTTLMCEGRPAGGITSCVYDRRAKAHVGIAMLDRRAAEEPAEVVTESGRLVTVSPLGAGLAREVRR